MPGGYEWLIIVGIVLLLFGAKKLPELARSVGQSARVFKGEMKGLRRDDEAGVVPHAALPPAASRAEDPAPTTAPASAPAGADRPAQPPAT